jgi:hypothetical protein
MMLALCAAPRKSGAAAVGNVGQSAPMIAAGCSGLPTIKRPAQVAGRWDRQAKKAQVGVAGGGGGGVMALPHQPALHRM